MVKKLAYCYKEIMKTIEEIRLKNLDLLIEEIGSAASLAKKADTDPNYISQIKTRVPSRTGKPRDIGSDLARKLEEACNKPRGWMDHAHDNILNEILYDENIMHVAKEMLAMEESAKYRARSVFDALNQTAKNDESSTNGNGTGGKRHA